MKRNVLLARYLLTQVIAKKYFSSPTLSCHFKNLDPPPELLSPTNSLDGRWERDGHKARFLFGDFYRANKRKVNVIGY